MVAEDGVVVPNAYRFAIAPKDHERLSSFGDALNAELVTVLHRTADERGWKLRGPGRVEVVPDDDVAPGRYEIAGKVDPGAVSPPARQPSDAPAPATSPAPAAAQPRTSVTTATLRDDTGHTHALSGSRMTVGRDPSCDIVLSDSTVSREHAALVRRGDTWWVLDLGSTNGTRVAGVQAAEQSVRDGAQIAFGEAVLTFDEGG
jgi:hypothetical protein